MGSSVAWSPPTGMHEVLDLAANTSPSASGVSISVNSEFLPTATTTGARTASAASGSTATEGCAFIFALRGL